jgi:thiol-disulfide isomerase/thioredoxin
VNKRAQIVLFVGVAALGAAIGVALHLATRERPMPSIPAAAAAPALMAAKLPDLDAHPQTLEQWRGKVIVVNFWATWCAPCRDEIPELIKVQSEFGPKGVQIVGIAIDEADKVRPYAANMKMNYPVLIGDADGAELAQRAGNPFGALPFTVVLDRRGNAVHSHLGSLTVDSLRAVIQPLL